jgi:hypothetical protein
VSRRAALVETSAGALGDTAFLDGRTTFWKGEPRAVPFDSLLATPAGDGQVLRFMFHMSFCGSTLLARLVGEAAGALALKEPQCLVDLADWKKALDGQQLRDAAFEPLLAAGLQPIRNGALAPPVLVKPSNWANSLLPLLAGSRPAMKPVFVTIALPAFLIAVFRGGRDRLAFTARVASHLASAFESGGALVGEAIAASPDPLGRAANLAALAHRLQEELFNRARAADGWGGAAVIDFAQILTHPEACVEAAARGLELRAGGRDAAEAVRLWSRRNAKLSGATFEKHGESGADRAVEREHASRFRTSIAWAQKLDIGRLACAREA